MTTHDEQEQQQSTQLQKATQPTLLESNMSQSSVPVAAVPPLPSALTASALAFLQNYAATQRFRAGQPSHFSFTATGDCLYYLRTASGSSNTQNLYQLDVTSGEERLLLTPHDLSTANPQAWVKPRPYAHTQAHISAADKAQASASASASVPASAPSASPAPASVEEECSEEERKLRERQRVTSRGLSSYQLCPCSSTRLLLSHASELYVFDTSTGMLANVTQQSALSALGPPAYAQWAHDGSRIACVRGGDICIIELHWHSDKQQHAAESEVMPVSSLQWEEWRVTYSGSAHLVNGIAEFVAQEEIGRFRGMWWSPDSDALLFQQTDTSDMEQLSILNLSDPAHAPHTQPYPRPGKHNAKLRLGIVQLERPNKQTMGAAADVHAVAADVHMVGEGGSASPAKKRKLLAASSGEQQHPAQLVTSSDSTPPIIWLNWDTASFPYLLSVCWPALAPLTLVLQNRVQTVMSVMLVEDEASGSMRELLRHTDAHWLEADHSVPCWLADGQHLLYSSYSHADWLTLELYNRQGQRVRALHDPAQVQYRKLLQVDEKRGVVYVLGGNSHAGVSSATEQHIFRIPLGVSADGACESPSLSSVTPSRPPPTIRRTYPATTVQLTTSPAVHSAVFAPAGVGVFVHESHSLTHGSRWVVRSLKHANKLIHSPPPSTHHHPDAMQLDCLPPAAVNAAAGSATASNVSAVTIPISPHRTSTAAPLLPPVPMLTAMDPASSSTVSLAAPPLPVLEVDAPVDDEHIGFRNSASPAASPRSLAHVQAAALDEDGVTAGTLLAVISNVAASPPVEYLPRVELREVVGSEQVAFDEAALSAQLIAADSATNPLTHFLQIAAPSSSSSPALDPSPSTAASPAPLTLTFNVAIVRPHYYDSSRRYPVVCYVYGGPGHRLVTCDRSTFYLAQWIANLGFIVVTTDNRGTPMRGASWEKCIDGDFAELPLRDQCIVLRTLAASDASMDLSKGVGIYGWSFGGYMSALAAMRYPSLFSAAFVGAPVCDWRDYDTYYVERVLGLPGDSASAYDRCSVLTYARQLLRPLLLVHGYADDNVYFCHAIQLSAALFAAGRAHTFVPLAGTHMLANPTGLQATQRRQADDTVRGQRPLSHMHRCVLLAVYLLCVCLLLLRWFAVRCFPDTLSMYTSMALFLMQHLCSSA